ncbi:MAG TPA: Calx-beta domain-containing protein [Allosphingosinicella sp.]|nr:Calx-beta domain-containing protein [Allosphingosinicella sp.]
MAAGDIAIVGFSADHKSFAFVVLASFAADTIVNFTDNGWQSSGSFRTGEGTLSITIPANTPLGTVVYVTGANGTGAAANTASGTALTLTRNGSLDFAQAGDQLLAYTGTAASPEFLFAVDFADSNSTWSTTASNSNTSAVPTGLVEGETALAFGPDIGSYSGSTSGSRAEILARLANASNWTFSETASPTYPGNFTVSGNAPSLSISDVSQDENSGVFTFTVTLSAPAGPGGVTFDIATADGTATVADADYIAQSLTGQTIPEGQTSYQFTVTVNGDQVREGNETFFVNVTNIAGAAAGDTQGQGTILDDDTPALSIADVSQAEGNAGATVFSFVVTLDRPAPAGGVTFDIATQDSSAAAGSDYIARSLTAVTIPEGATSYTFDVTVNGDTAVESDETFLVNISNVTGASIADGQATGTIRNDDTAVVPAASIADASIVEGQSGVSYLVFTVTLNAAPTGPVTIDFATANGTATAGSDYLAVAGTISFAAGETSKTISVPVIGDARVEAAETFTVTLSNPAGATLADGQALGTITNDDGPAYHSLATGTFSQDWSNIGLITANNNWSGVPNIIGYLGDIDSGSPTGVDPRALTGANLGQVQVFANQTNPNTNTSGGVAEFHIANPTAALQGSGTADAPSIVLYMDASGRQNIRFQANIRDIDGSADNAVQQVAVQYRTDPNGAWTNVPGGYIADATTVSTADQVTAIDVILPAGANNAATLQIRILTTNAAGSDEWVGIDDILVSSELAPVSYSIDDSAAFEGSGGGTTPISFTVTRAGDTGEAGTVDYAVGLTAGGFSASASDFASPLTGTVSFAAGETSRTITLDIVADSVAEADEGFTVTLSNPSSGSVADGTATGTIVNDDGAPALVTIADVSQAEGNDGVTVFTFTVTRTGGTDAFTIDYQTIAGTAQEGSDYEGASGTLSFAAGENSKTIQIRVNGDTAGELAETFTVQLSNPVGAVLSDGEAVGTIQNDDVLFISQIQGSSYYSPILAAEGKNGFNIASATTVVVRAVVTAVDGVGPRQGFYLTEEYADWDASDLTSEGIFVMTRNDANVGTTLESFAAGLKVGDLITITAQVMEYQAFSSMPRTILANPTGFSILSSGNPLPVLLLDASRPIPNAILTAVTPDYTDSQDDPDDTFDAVNYGLSFWETVEGMLVTIPDMVVADGFVQTSGGQPIFQAYSTVHANPDQINSRGGYTVAGDPPLSPPDTPEAEDAVLRGGRHLHDGDVNPDIIEVDFSGFAMNAPAGLTQSLSMGDRLGDITGIVDFDFTDRKLFVTSIDPAGIVDTQPAQETTALGNDPRSLTVATFNVENLDPGDGAARFEALAQAIAKNLNAPDIISIEEIQDNDGATNSGTTDASVTWQMLVDALNAAVPGARYQWVDQAPNNNAEGGQGGGNIRVGFLYNTNRVQLGDLPADATIEERRQFTDRIGDGVRDAGDRIAFSDNMIAGEINPADWTNTRLSLLGEFRFNGNTVFVTANHFTAKGGSGEFWQFNQNLEAGQPTNSGFDRRVGQANDVYTMLNFIKTAAPAAGVVAGGDFNDFYFYRPLEVLTGYVLPDGSARTGGVRLDNLTLTLAEAERYTYTFDGRSQAIDHIIADQMLSAVATYDIVHLNTGYNALGTGANTNPALSDHDPAVASFNFRSFNETLTGTAANETIDGGGGNDVINLSSGGDDVALGGEGNDLIYYGGAFTNADSNDGGAGVDRVGLLGNYRLTFDADDLVNIERLELYGSSRVAGSALTSYDIATIDANVGAGQTLFITAGSLNASETLTFNGTAETDGRFVVHGGAGMDVIAGGAQSDYLIGNEGNDRLFGLGGDDILVGNAGADMLRGGFGRDIFRYLEASDSGTAEGTSDRIVDFQIGLDKIDVSGIDAGSEPGDQAFTFIGSNAFSAPGQIRSTFDANANAWRVEGDIDGDGQADFAILVVTFNETPLTANDFML